jgi:hypothetical protein
MSTAVLMEHIGQASPQCKARIAGVSYLLTFVAGIFALRGGLVANVIATVAYVAVTLLFYDIFKPVIRSLSLLAAFFSFAGLAWGALDMFHLAPFNISNLVFFGFYCALIGYLILRSTFLPRILGVLMVIAGLGWLTYLSPPFANYLAPYNMASGILGEGSLTLWLMVMGVNVERWREQASAAD